jgi:hypothetical protein
MAAVRGAQAQGERAILTQRVGAEVPAVEITVELLGIEAGLRFCTHQADVPLLVDSPVGPHDQTLGGMLQNTGGVTIYPAAMPQCLQPDPPVAFATSRRRGAFPELCAPLPLSS